MHSYNARLKTSARITLQGRYGMFSGGCLLILLISGVLETLPVSLLGQVPGTAGILLRLALAFSISVFTSMLMVGLSRMALLACRGQEITFSDLFYAFSTHSDRLLWVKTILALITLVLEIPDFILTWLYLRETFTRPVYLALTNAWGFLSVFLGCVLTMWFALSIYLLMDYESLSADDSLKQSAALMRGRKGRYLYLRFSFLGMYLLGILSLFIGFLWIIPYQETALAQFYLEIQQGKQHA